MDCMRTGFDASGGSTVGGVDHDFMRKSVSILRVLTEESLRTAACFADACGRTRVSARDMTRALKYESEAFWEKDIDARFAECLTEESVADYGYADPMCVMQDRLMGEARDEDQSEEGSFSDSDGCSDPGTASDPGEASDAADLESDSWVRGDRELHAKVLDAEQRWLTWQPSDPVKCLLKRCIDRADSAHASS